MPAGAAALAALVALMRRAGLPFASVWPLTEYHQMLHCSCAKGAVGGSASGSNLRNRHGVVAMTPNVQMEQRSLAVVRVLAADAGFQVVRPEVDSDSVDGMLIAEFGRRPRIEFQAKATQQDVVSGDRLRFSLPIKNYRELSISSLVPRILIVALMPGISETWLLQSDEELCVRSRMYWLSLAGMPDRSNDTSVTVIYRLLTFSTGRNSLT